MLIRLPTNQINIIIPPKNPLPTKIPIPQPKLIISPKLQIPSQNNIPQPLISPFSTFCTFCHQLPPIHHIQRISLNIHINIHRVQKMPIYKYNFQIHQYTLIKFNLHSIKLFYLLLCLYLLLVLLLESLTINELGEFVRYEEIGIVMGLGAMLCRFFGGIGGGEGGWRFGMVSGGFELCISRLENLWYDRSYLFG